LQKPEGSIAKASGGEAVVILLRTSGNTGYGALRRSQCKAQALEGAIAKASRVKP
jgi:hypothetical protein